MIAQQPLAAIAKVASIEKGAERIAPLTSIRFFAALYVVLYHTFPDVPRISDAVLLPKTILYFGFTSVGFFFVLIWIHFGYRASPINRLESKAPFLDRSGCSHLSNLHTLDPMGSTASFDLAYRKIRYRIWHACNWRYSRRARYYDASMVPGAGWPRFPELVTISRSILLSHVPISNTHHRIDSKYI